MSTGSILGEGRLQSHWSKNELRAIELLGSGCAVNIVASAIGVDSSRVSQLLADPQFAEEVTARKVVALSRHNQMDSTYDDMEMKLAESLRSQLPMIMRPMEILKALKEVNSLKRRGVASAEQITQQTTVVNLLMPNNIVHQFTANINNQVIQVGDQTLETIQSNTLLNLVKQKSEGLHNDLPGTTRTANLELPITGSDLATKMLSRT